MPPVLHLENRYEERTAHPKDYGGLKPDDTGLLVMLTYRYLMCLDLVLRRVATGDKGTMRGQFLEPGKKTGGMFSAYDEILPSGAADNDTHKTPLWRSA